jgi:pantoate--beta-alanine ligase
MKIEVVSCPTVREESGLACSSRNIRLSADEKARSAAIYRLLQEAENAAAAGNVDSKILHDKICKGLVEAGMEVEYVEIVDAKTLLHVNSIEEETLIAVAVFIGEIRLIDNILIPGRFADSEESL